MPGALPSVSEEPTVWCGPFPPSAPSPLPAAPSGRAPASHRPGACCLASTSLPLSAGPCDCSLGRWVTPQPPSGAPAPNLNTSDHTRSCTRLVGVRFSPSKPKSVCKDSGFCRSSPQQHAPGDRLWKRRQGARDTWSPDTGGCVFEINSLLAERSRGGAGLRPTPGARAPGFDSSPGPFRRNPLWPVTQLRGDLVSPAERGRACAPSGLRLRGTLGPSPAQGSRRGLAVLAATAVPRAGGMSA